jgi:hypothetical protein
MAPAKALEQLALRKRLLIAESDAQRLVLASALHRATSPLKWLDRAQAQAGPLLTVGAPIAGFWFARRTKGLKRWISSGWGVLRLAQTLRRFVHKPSSR